MSFASFEFLVFFAVVTTAYFIVPHQARWALLLAASCVFYMFFIPAYILILFFTIVVDYVAGILIENAVGARRRQYLALSLAANIGVLCVFKYANFAIENLNVAGHALGAGDVPLLRIVLPIGLSFHTFQAMSYTIEVYRGNQKAERHFGIYALYVMFYPQLVAGPIERPQNMLHQFHEEKTFDYERVKSGLSLMLWGFFKKIVVADRLAVIVSAVYKDPHAPGALVVLALAAFVFQVYGDFSGYSDIALGSARVMGFSLMVNFDTPLRTTSITEFWRRWHISLSSWFNDYLFTPLFTALRHGGKAGLAFSLFFTFVVSGLWHGAGWTFIVYGALHGLALVWEALAKKTRKRWAGWVGAALYERLSWVYMFSFVALSLAFFRAPTLAVALRMVSRALGVWAPGYLGLRSAGGDIAGLPSWKFAASFVPVALLMLAEGANRGGRLVATLVRQPAPVRFGLYYGAVAGILVFGAFGLPQFIYFQF